MTDLISNLSEISDRYDALFVDLWGCVHNGVDAFPDAIEALQKYRQSGGVVILLTNAPRPKVSVVAQLEKIGIPSDAYDEVVSSGDASQVGMIAGMAGHRVYHLGPGKDDSFFTDFAPELDGNGITRVALEQAEGIVCTGLFDDQSETPDDYRATLLYAKQKGLKLLCTNPDIVVDMGEQRIFCAGAIAALYTEMGGESLYFGKPHPPIYDLARRRLAPLKTAPDDRILCIGDGIHTDIRGGLSDGFDTLFITGGLAADQFGADANNPDPTLLTAYFNDHQLSPTAAIAHLQ